MFIGHLPAGYLTAKLSQRAGAGLPFTAILVGSIIPDIDMIYFYLFDGQSTHHHDYVTHRPILWGSILMIGLIFSQRWASGIGVGGILHMLMDTIVGKITWLWPISDYSAPLIIVPATQSHWVLSFLVHWTFGVEILLCIVAFYVWFRSSGGDGRKTGYDG